MASSTTKPLKASGAGFSYAAAASGKPKQAGSASATSTVDSNENSALSTPANGKVSGASTPQPSLSEDKSTVSGVSTPKSRNGEGKSENRDRANGRGRRAKDSDSKEPKEPKESKNSKAAKEAPTEPVKPKEFVPAPEPAVNIWKVRQESLAAKVKPAAPVASTTTLPAAPQPSTSVVGGAVPPGSGSSHEKGRKRVDRRNSSVVEATDKPREVASKENKDRRRTGDGKDRSTFKEDGNKSKSTKPKTQDPPSSTVPPPPLADTTSWPTPDSAKEEKPKVQERPTPAAPPKTEGSKREWIQLEVTPTVIFPGISMPKSGRGGRGGRGGGRGGSNADRENAKERNADRNVQTDGEQRGRSNQGERPSRGNHYGGRGNKRASSAGNNQHRAVNGTAASSVQKESAPINGVQTEKPAETKEQSQKSGDQAQQPFSSQFQQTDKVDRPQGHHPSPAFTMSPGRNAEINHDSNTITYQQSRDRGGPTNRGGFRGRGGYHNGNRGGFKNPRSQSMPGAAQYHRYPQYSMTNAYGTLPFQPMYEYGAGGYSPAPPYLDQAYITSAVRNQIEYYFSIQNLCKDLFLRKHMDAEGFVKIPFIASFNRVKQLTTDPNIIREACLSSDQLDFATGPEGDGIRTKKDWARWVLKEEDREPPAKGAAGPWRLITWQRPEMNGHGQHPISHSLPFPHGEGQQQFQQQQQQQYANGIPPIYPPMHYPPPLQTAHSADDTRHTLSANVAAFTPSNGVPNVNGSDMDESDQFPNSSIDSLVIVCKRSYVEGGSGFGSDAETGRPSSKGSIDGKTINEELLKYEGVSRFNASQQEETRFYPASPRISSEPETLNAMHGRQPEVGWYQKREESKDSPMVPYHDYLVHRQYAAFKDAALKKRAENGASSDMNILFRFWRHFLTAHFNKSIYEDFKRLALEDLDASNDVGISYLLKYYHDTHLGGRASKLSSKDFVALAKENKYAEIRDILKTILSNTEVPGQSKAQLKSFMDGELESILGISE